MQLFVFLTDGEIYEVDDPQENYDDIEASPEIIKAEVHDSPQTTPENSAGLVQRNEDCLMSGQDGWAKTQIRQRGHHNTQLTFTLTNLIKLASKKKSKYLHTVCMTAAWKLK